MERRRLNPEPHKLSTIVCHSSDVITMLSTPRSSRASEVQKYTLIAPAVGPALNSAAVPCFSSMRTDCDNSQRSTGWPWRHLVRNTCNTRLLIAMDDWRSQTIHAAKHFDVGSLSQVNVGHDGMGAINPFHVDPPASIHATPSNQCALNNADLPFETTRKRKADSAAGPCTLCRMRPNPR
jgi:hypothetical protein